MNPGKKENTASESRVPVARSGIDFSLLKRSRYTLSLLSEGQRTGLLDTREVSGIQHQFFLLLQNLIRRHTQGESSSVAVETAERLLASAMYAVDACLWSMGDPEKAIASLKTSGIASLHAEGVEQVCQGLEDTKRLYYEVKKHKLDVPVDAYNTTIEESLPIFIKKYNILFDAHNTMASIDYPLAIDDMSLQGVYYIEQYLKRLHLENQFCRRWERDEMLRLLENFGRVCKFDYRIELFNIFELAFHHALFSVLSGGDARRILISPYQYEVLERMFTHADAARIGAMIDKAVNRLQEQLPAPDPGTADYMKQCCRDLVRRIVNAAEHRKLQAVILTDKAEGVKPAVISLKAGESMGDVRLRRLLDEIMRSETKAEKIRLIRSHFFSLHDYLDLLESGCLYGDEYEALYAEFGDMELAILCKIVFYEELRSGASDLQDILQERKEAERDWQNHLIGFLKRLGASRIRKIDEWIGNIDYEEIRFY
jgi:hypothetical protein